LSPQLALPQNNTRRSTKPPLIPQKPQKPRKNHKNNAKKRKKHKNHAKTPQNTG
jgi:hypothetical protein